uniref:Small ribosomal subunit protein mS23 n=1 Tax=Ascaris lumbricoides TaxID=6252 RepID=A0A9J2PT28_ASCLU
MASYLTRAERSGSIFFRVTGLIRAGHLKWEQRPLWYDVYAAVPPLREPIWDAKFPKEGEPVRKIFYEEDLLRARFYKRYRSVGAISIENSKSKSISQLFIEQYNVEREQNPQMSDDELFQKTVTTLQSNGIPLKQPSRRTLRRSNESKNDDKDDESVRAFANQTNAVE